MLKNLLKVSLRGLQKHPRHALINVAGLVVGIASCLIIFLVIQREKSFDNFHENSDRIYRLVRDVNNQGKTEYSSGIPFPVSEGLRRENPDLNDATAILGDGQTQVVIPGSGPSDKKKYKEEGVFRAEPNFFRIFNFPLLAGNPATALENLDAVLLKKSTAAKYFGSWQNAMGKTIRFHERDFTVSGVMADPPENTDFPLNIVSSYASIWQEVKRDDWESISETSCFVRLPEKYSKAQLESWLTGFVQRHIQSPGATITYSLKAQPLDEMHFDARFGTFSHRNFSRELIGILTLIGSFLLLMASINYINLATARASLRAREVGVRKVLGGNKAQLMRQFFAEAGVTCLIGLILGAAVAAVALPSLNDLLETHLRFDFWRNPGLVLFMVIALLAITILSGLYPAMVLSRFNPVSAFRSRLYSSGNSGISMRRGLVLFQFVVAQVLVTGMIVVINQMDFFRNADSGFNKEAVITADIPNDSLSLTRIDVLRNRVAALPGVKKISFSLAAPTFGGRWFTNLSPGGDWAGKAGIVVNMQLSDSAYFDLYKLHMAAGRVFFNTDTPREFVINQTLASMAGWKTPGEAVGKLINVNGRTAPISGVVKDFHTNSLRDPIDPIVMTPSKKRFGTVNIQLDGSQAKATIALLEKCWNDLYPDFVFQFSFLDETVAGYYRQESQLSQLYKIFSGIAMLISCLGLYGLVSFMVERRRKEIGVRKVLGAPIANIVYLLSREFSLIIIISFLVAAPVAWYVMHQWLEQYAYKIELGPRVFMLTFAGSLLISWATIGHSAIQAARANPVKSLRSE